MYLIWGKWLSQGIGDPTLIQFLDNGNNVFSAKIGKIPEIEK